LITHIWIRVATLNKMCNLYYPERKDYSQIQSSLSALSDSSLRWTSTWVTAVGNFKVLRRFWLSKLQAVQVAGVAAAAPSDPFLRK